MTLGVIEQQFWQSIEREAKPEESAGIKVAALVTIKPLMRDKRGHDLDYTTVNYLYKTVT